MFTWLTKRRSWKSIFGLELKGPEDRRCSKCDVRLGDHAAIAHPFESKI